MVHDTVELVADVEPILEPDFENNTYYGNPYVAYEGDEFGFGAGMLLSSRPLYTGDAKDDPFEDHLTIYPTGHIRFGKLSKLYFSGHLWEGVPVYSGGGFFVVGVGGRPLRSLELYAGYCTEGPYEEESVLARVTFDITRSWTLMTTVRFPTEFSNQFGPYEENKESGVSLGLSYRRTTFK